MRWLLTASALLFTACGSSPSSTTAPATPRWQLTGTVRSSGSPVVSATVKVMDGADAGQSTSTDIAGHYGFSGGLAQGIFTIQVSATGYDAATQSVTLTGNQTADVTLTRQPQAILIPAPGTVSGVLQSDGRYAVPLTGVNNGPDCATRIAGVTTFARADGSVVTSLSWSLPTSTVVGPNQTFTYSVCCLTSADAFAAVSYSTVFTSTAVACQ